MYRQLLLKFVLLLFCSAYFATLAQADCPAFVTAALASAEEACQNLERDQVCYGNAQVEAAPREESAEFTFQAVGDKVDAIALDSLELTPLNLMDETWGIALAKLKSGLPDALLGKNVVLLMFGDVQLQNAAPPVIEVPIQSTGNINVRLRPTTAENNVIASLTNGREVIANGRLADNSWVRIMLPDDETVLGWVSASLVTTDGDLNTLSIVQPGDPVFGPLQAFTFRTGYADRPCDTAPDSGILLQTPTGVESVRLSVNGVEIISTATMYLQTDGTGMIVNVLAGSATVESHGIREGVPAGVYIRIPLGDSGLASDTPEFIQPYDAQALKALPLRTGLPRVAVVVPPLDADEIAIESALANGLPPNGEWDNINTVTQNTCDPTTLPVGDVSGASMYLTFSPDRSSFYLAWGNDSPGYTFYQSSELTYVSTDGPYLDDSPATWTITFTSATTYTGIWYGSFGDPNNGGCVYAHDTTGVYLFRH